MADEKVDERAEPRLPLVERRRVRLTSADEWWLLVSADLADDPPGTPVVSARGLVAECRGEVGRGGTDRMDHAWEDLAGAAADGGGVGEQLLGPDLVDDLLLR